MPCSNGQRDHNELCQDQRRKADRYDVNELVLEQNQRTVHYYATLVYTDQHPHKERLIAQAAPFGKLFVQLRIGERYVGADVLI